MPIKPNRADQIKLLYENHELSGLGRVCIAVLNINITASGELKYSANGGILTPVSRREIVDAAA